MPSDMTLVDHAPVPDVPLVVHVGYHKTGTTFLQRQFFAQHPGIQYLGKPWANQEVASFFAAFNFRNALEFDTAVARQQLGNLMALAHEDDASPGELKGERGRPIVVSQESLHTGPEWFGVSVAPMIERLRIVAPAAKVLLTIRNQVAYVDSFYRNYVFHGGKLSLHKFLYDSYFFDCGLGPKLKYDRVIRLYQDAFGASRVYVMLHEDLRRDPRSELKNVCSFMGVQETVFAEGGENVGLNSLAVPWIRAVNQILASDFHQEYYEIAAPRPSGWRSRARRRVARGLRKAAGHSVFSKFRKGLLRPPDVDYITDYFAASNARLEKVLGRDLNSQGYATGR